MKSALPALLFLLAATFLHAAEGNPPTPERKVISRPAIEERQLLEVQPGENLLVRAREKGVMPASEYSLFPTARPVTIRKDDEGKFTIEFDRSKWKSAIDLTDSAIVFQTVQKDSKRLETTIYMASRQADLVRGMYYTITSGEGVAEEGRFSLQPRE